MGPRGEAIAIAIEKGVSRGLARIEAARRFRGLNQTQLAGLAGVSASTVSRLERGLRPGPDLLMKLATILEVTPDMLFRD